MPYIYLIQLHKGVSMLALVLTLGWMFVVSAAPNRPQSLEGARRLIYIGAAVATGLVGLGGLILTMAGPWVSAVFPWVGMAAVIVHIIVGTRARNALSIGNRTRARLLARVQIAALAAGYGFMVTKPF